jgi:hypothetical protein
MKLGGQLQALAALFQGKALPVLITLYMRWGRPQGQILADTKNLTAISQLAVRHGYLIKLRFGGMYEGGKLQFHCLYILQQ